jgi:hypothetical protein
MFIVFLLFANIASLQNNVDGGGAGQVIQNAWNSVVNAFNSVINSVVNAFKKLISDSNKLLDQAKKALNETLRKGNLVDASLIN